MSCRATSYGVLPTSPVRSVGSSSHAADSLPAWGGGGGGGGLLHGLTSSVGISSVVHLVWQR
jgi:hypothetical protein